MSRGSGPPTGPGTGAGAPADGAACSPDQGCITCGDVAVAVTVLEVTGSDARCRDDRGREESVAVELVGPVEVGDALLVHAGVAIERLTPNQNSATPTRGRPDALRR